MQRYFSAGIILQLWFRFERLNSMLVLLISYPGHKITLLPPRKTDSPIAVFFLQKKWKPALENNSNNCERMFLDVFESSREFTCDTFTACNCHGHSGDCYYDSEIDEKRLSMDTHGNYEGGGVCRNCQVSIFITTQYL